MYFDNVPFPYASTSSSLTGTPISISMSYACCQLVIEGLEFEYSSAYLLIFIFDMITVKKIQCISLFQMQQAVPIIDVNRETNDQVIIVIGEILRKGISKVHKLKQSVPYSLGKRRDGLYVCRVLKNKYMQVLSIKRNRVKS